MVSDEVVLVRSSDEVQGVMDKHQAHRHPAQLHRASSVWLINDAGEILLQKRSDKKIVGAGWWANTVCGNLVDGESYEQGALRRLKEELGIENVQLEELYKFSYRAYCNGEYGEHEIDTVFLARGTADFYKNEIKPNADEVAEIAWVQAEDLARQLKDVPYVLPAATLELSLVQLAEQTPPMNVKIGGRAVGLAPWTVMMLQDSRLLNSLS